MKIYRAFLITIFIILAAFIMVYEEKIKSVENELATIKSNLENQLSLLSLLRNRLLESKETKKPEEVFINDNLIKSVLLALEKNPDFFNLVYENLWRKMFVWSTFFESLDGYNLTVPAGGNINVDGEDLVLNTGATANNEARVLKQPSWQGVSTFFKKNSFRTAFVLNSVSNVEAWLTFGNSADANAQFYGFKILNNVLKGVSSDGSGTIKEIDLTTINPNVVYSVEARYYPNEKIVFYVRDPNLPSIYSKEWGAISDKMPKPQREPQGTVNAYVMDVRLKTTNAVSKTMQLSFWQFIQSREYNP
jgi:hypothetical protein